MSAKIKGAFKKDGTVKFIDDTDNVRIAVSESETKHLIDKLLLYGDSLDVLAFGDYYSCECNLPINFTSGDAYRVLLTLVDEDNIVRDFIDFVSNEAINSVDKILISYPYKCVDENRLYKIQKHGGKVELGAPIPPLPDIEGILFDGEFYNVGMINAYMDGTGTEYIRSSELHAAIIRYAGKLRFVYGLYTENETDLCFEDIAIKGKKRQQLIRLYNTQTGYPICSVLAECFSPKIKKEYAYLYKLYQGGSDS